MTTWRVSVAVATPGQADYPGLRSLVLIDTAGWRVNSRIRVVGDGAPWLAAQAANSPLSNNPSATTC